MNNKTKLAYPLSNPIAEHQILEKAADIIAIKFINSAAFTERGLI
ncbi:MAG: hypothetical protein ACI88H_000225 [Cocleimonas sp.]|jgi:hypothetical protein